MFKSSKGMTLIEIMIVLTIIGVLFSFLAGRIFGKKDKANVKTAKIIMQDLGEKLEDYYNDCGFYPKEDLGLEALTEKGRGSCDNWGPEPYLRKVPKDPWNNPFIYESDGSSYKIISLGKGGRVGGDGYEKDLVYPDDQ